MNKPDNYDSMIGSIENITLGGHIMTIKKAEESTTKTGKEMLKVYLDTDVTDKQPEYFRKKYDAMKNFNQKWGCIVYLFPTSSLFKSFVTAVEESNNAKAQWGDQFCEWLKNKKVGGVFGQKEYVKQDNTVGIFTTCQFFKNIDTIKQGVPVPSLVKLTAEQQKKINNTAAAEPDNYIDLCNLQDVELPFK